MTAPFEGGCLNCGSPLTGEFCSTCGQKVPHRDVTLREFLHDSTEQLVNWDGKIPQTLKTLFLEPGRLTVDFLEGRRARWLMPLRVYLICSLAYFVGKPLVEAITHRSAREMAQVSITNEDGSKTISPEAMKDIEQGLPARIFGKERLMRAVNNSQQLNAEIDKAFPKAMFILLPFFALLTSIAWRRRGLRYPAHLYFALHVHAAWFGAMTVSTLATGFLPTSAAVAIGLVLLTYMFWYALVAIRRVFGGSWGRTLVTSASVTFVYFTAWGVVSLGLLALVLFQM
jgi:hypothetical protein